jgi:antirestriction protein ArdC
MPAEESSGRDKVHRLAEEALQRLLADLQAGRSETLKNYLATMGRFHRYSWTNTLLIHTQRPTATRVAGYHTWRDLGRFVKRGEKGIVIYAPLVTKTPAPEKASEPALTASQETRRVTGFRAAYVFDLDQTEGRPLPAFAATAGDPKEYGAKLKALVAQRGIALHYDPSIAPADGLSSGGQIRLRPGLSPAEEFSVLTHELAHEMLHRGSNRSELPKVVRETQAEAVAFVVSRGIGLETGSAAADYIALYNGDAKTLAESLAAIQHTSSNILNDLLEERLPQPASRTLDAGHSFDPFKESGPREANDPGPARPPVGPDPSDSVSLDR